MIDADALAGPALFTLWAAVPVCCVLTGLGRQGLRVALVLFGLLAAVNLTIAFNVSEYGDFGAALIVATGFLTLILLLVSWNIGSHLRTQRAEQG